MNANHSLLRPETLRSYLHGRGPQPFDWAQIEPEKNTRGMVDFLGKHDLLGDLQIMRDGQIR
jgi:hypothetical protein